MNKVKLLIGAATILLASAFTFIIPVDWKVKDDYLIKFRFGRLTFGKDIMEAPFGTFKGLKSNISFDEVNPEKSKIKATIDATTFDTKNPSMDAHAKGSDVLDVEKFPVIAFESTAIIKTSTGYEATGNLTLKDITKEIKFQFVFEKETFSGGFTIETKDFNITRYDAPKEVSIFLTIPVIH